MIEFLSTCNLLAKETIYSNLINFHRERREHFNKVFKVTITLRQILRNTCIIYNLRAFCAQSKYVDRETTALKE